MSWYINHNWQMISPLYLIHLIPQLSHWSLDDTPISLWSCWSHLAEQSLLPTLKANCYKALDPEVMIPNVIDQGTWNLEFSFRSLYLTAFTDLGLNQRAKCWNFNQERWKTWKRRGSKSKMKYHKFQWIEVKAAIQALQLKLPYYFPI